MKRMVKLFLGIVFFAVVLTIEATGYVTLSDRKVEEFEARMTEIVGLPVQAEYYGKSSDYHEPVLIYVEGDSTALKAAVAKDSQYRFADSLNYAKISNSDIGYETVGGIKTIGQIFLGLAVLTFIAFTVFVIKV